MPRRYTITPEKLRESRQKAAATRLARMTPEQRRAATRAATAASAARAARVRELLAEIDGASAA